MGLFRRKKVEDDDEEEFDELEDERPRKRRRIRDLKPENREKRTLPAGRQAPKPWGKFERMVVLISLAFTLITALILTMYANGARPPKINFDISRFNIFEEQTIIIENE